MGRHQVHAFITAANLYQGQTDPLVLHHIDQVHQSFQAEQGIAVSFILDKIIEGGEYFQLPMFIRALHDMGQHSCFSNQLIK